MNWFKRNWWMFAIFVVLTVVVIVLLVVGISTHTEAGIQRVCWRPDGVAVYAPCGVPTMDSDRLSEPRVIEEDLVWPSGVPITIAVRAHSGSADDLAQALGTVGASVELWNDQLGFEAFRITSEGPAATVLIWGVPSDATGTSEGGSCSHRRSASGVLTAEVAIIHVATTRLAYLVTVHELGHLIGLAHDDFSASPMYPTTRDDTEDERLSFTRVTDWDRDLLRRMYGGR